MSIHFHEICEHMCFVVLGLRLKEGDIVVVSSSILASLYIRTFRYDQYTHIYIFPADNHYILSAYFLILKSRQRSSILDKQYRWEIPVPYMLSANLSKSFFQVCLSIYVFYYYYYFNLWKVTLWKLKDHYTSCRTMCIT